MGSIVISCCWIFLKIRESIMAHSSAFLKLTFLIGLVKLVVCFTPNTHYGKGVGSIEEFISIGFIPFKTCKDACLSRTRCNALLYRPNSKVCRLGSKVITDSDVIPMSGSILVSGFNKYHKTEHVCGDKPCELKETCVEKRSRVHQCEVTECGPPEKGGDQLFLGNMYSVGNKLQQVHTPQYTATCSPAGSWVVEKTSTGRIIIGKRDCMTLSISTPGIALFGANPVLCDIQTDGGNWLIFQRRLDGSENFYRDWEDYVNGFGNLTGEFWLGLEELHTIVSNNQQDQFELRIDLEDFEGETRYARYGRFNISDASDAYRLSVGEYSGTAGDSMRYHDGMRFSTYDRDNDKASSHCARIYTGAWWYNRCHKANLNGAYYHNGENTSTFADKVIWSHWKGPYYSLKNSEMKIRKLT